MDFLHAKNFKIPTLIVPRAVTVTFGSVRSFFVIVVCGRCDVGVFLFFVTAEICSITAHSSRHLPAKALLLS